MSSEEIVCTCFLVMAWEDPCPRHGAIPGTVAARESASSYCAACKDTGCTECEGATLPIGGDT